MKSEWISRLACCRAALLTGVLLGVSCTPSTPVQVQEEVQAEPPATGPTRTIEVDGSALELGRIDVASSELGTIPRELVVAGRVGVNLNRTVRVGALLDGRVSEILKNVGDRVKEGEVLARLNSPEVDDTRAEFAKAMADLERCEAELGFRQTLRERAARLHELKAGSLEAVQKADADINQAKAAITIAQAEVSRLEERLEHLGLSVEGALEEYTHPEGVESGDYRHYEMIEVVAPAAGTVLERLVTPGSVVSSSDDLFVVSDLSSIWIQAEVPEEYLASLREGQEAEVRVEAFPGETFPARLEQIGDVLNVATRTAQVRCGARNAQGKLRSEMYATITFRLSSSGPCLTVSRDAVQRIEGRDVVFVQVGPNSFQPRYVTLGQSSQALVEVVDGLAPGDSVAVKGSFLLKSELLKSQMDE